MSQNCEKLLLSGRLVWCLNLFINLGNLSPSIFFVVKTLFDQTILWYIRVKVVGVTGSLPILEHHLLP